MLRYEDTKYYQNPISIKILKNLFFLILKYLNFRNLINPK